jgi:hypothetical protein
MSSMQGFVAATIGCLSLTSGFAAAQAPLPYQTPAVSPYLSLFRQGSPPAVNYYNLVRPQIDYNSSIQQLQQQVGVNRQGIADLQTAPYRANPALPPTGFVPQFQSQRSYFMTYSGVGGTGLGGTGMGGGIPNRGTGRAGVTLPGAMGVPALGAPALGVPAMATPRIQ